MKKKITATPATRLADCDSQKCGQHRSNTKKADRCMTEVCPEEVRAYVQHLIDRLDARAAQAKAQRQAASELRAALRRAPKEPLSASWAASVAWPALHLPRV